MDIYHSILPSFLWLLCGHFDIHTLYFVFNFIQQSSSAARIIIFFFSRAEITKENGRDEETLHDIP
jgi:hypothetical protein